MILHLEDTDAPHTADGGNLAPPYVPKALGITVVWGFQRVEDFLHQQYDLVTGCGTEYASWH